MPAFSKKYHNQSAFPYFFIFTNCVYKEFGMNASTAFNIFARAVVRERKIPFEISAQSSISLEDGRAAFNALRRSAEQNNLQELSLDDINAEIQLARNSKA